MDFLADNWIAILSLFIALIGGTPGVIAVINHLRNRPTFAFSLANMIVGKYTEAGKTYSLLMLTGTVSNKGEKPLVPAYFTLEATVKNQRILFQRRLIPEDVQFPSDSQQIDVDKPWLCDLQKLSVAVSMQTPAYGHLMFLSNSIDRDSLIQSRPRILRLTCVDIFNKKYTATLKPDDLSKLESPTEYPKHGIRVQPKN